VGDDQLPERRSGEAADVTDLNPTCRLVHESITRVTDEELLLLARQGDSDAFDQLVVRHQGIVYRTALAALRLPQDAEEVAQDALVRAWVSLRRFRGDSSFRTWVVTITWNLALSRRGRVRRWWSRRVDIDTQGLAESRDQTDTLAIVSELRAHIIGAIEALTPKLRDALLLAQSGDYDYEEIAAMLRIPVGTVKWRVSEARRKVRARLAQVGYADA
jgi:RNA polymerase sigma-70 factor, ECF subfamily